MIAETLHWIDWLVIVLFMVVTLLMGLYFTKRAGTNIESFFLSGRSIPWYIAGGSLIATSFAADTPLWITSLVRQYGIYYAWQYWAPFIGGALAIVLFARLWRRLAVLTDIEFIEIRYAGKAAKSLRFFLGVSTALFFCPLIIGWVTKAMETISREAMGLPPEYRYLTTIIVIGVALVMCALSGLWGVVYTDFLQFGIATLGTITLAVMSVIRVGGLGQMVAKLSANQEWNGHNLNIAPSIGSGPMQMSVWNAIGFFGILWIMVALSGGYNAQRLLACKNSKHSTLAMLMHTLLYYAVISWPWIVVALCSVILFPTLPEGVTNDSAYPKMIMTVLPIGLRGLLVSALLAAFISTISTMFNWGSSYLVNDVYKRFIFKQASSKHYILVARIMTVVLAISGGIISFAAKDIQQLLAISYVLGSGTVLIAMLRWFWWRLNGPGDLAGTITAWIIAILLLFVKAFDAPARVVLGLGEDVAFSSDPNLLGARMVFVVIVVTLVAVVVSYLTKPTDIIVLKKFIIDARPFHFFWKPVIEKLDMEYVEHESLGRTIISWFIALACTFSLLYGVGKLILGEIGLGVACLVVFSVTLYWTVKRINHDFDDEENRMSEISEQQGPER